MVMDQGIALLFQDAIDSFSNRIFQWVSIPDTREPQRSLLYGTREVIIVQMS